MIIREIINLYKLNWKAHLWSLLIPLIFILISRIGKNPPNISSLMLPIIFTYQWVSGIRFTLEKERENGFYKTIVLLALGKEKILLSRIIYFHINCYIYLGLLFPFFSFDGESGLSFSETIWIFTFATYMQIFAHIKFGKDKKIPQNASKKQIILVLLYAGITITGLIPNFVLKVISLIALIVIAKFLFDDLLNYYPINRELSENERY